MQRRTTPLVKVELPEDGNLCQAIRINFAQDRKIIFIKNKDDLTFTSEGTGANIKYYGSVRLTQEETLKFKARMNLEIETDVKDSNGIVPEIMPIVEMVEPVINEEVL